MPRPKEPDARERLIFAAAETFYRAGIVATSVDEVVAAAGVSKPTLYSKFRSKDELLEAALRQFDQRRRDLIASVLDSAKGTPSDRLLTLFDWLCEWLTDSDFRGCALVNAAAEVGGSLPVSSEIAAANKHWVRERLTRLAQEAGLQAAEELAAGLVLLIEGATTMAMLGDRAAAGYQARAAARRLLSAHCADLDTKRNR